MPTTTWIQETVEDRYWESRQAAHYIAPRSPEFACAVCARTFPSADQRSWHANEEHPLARPTLYVGDHAAPSVVIVRTPIGGEEVSVGSCTSLTATLDGVIIAGVKPVDLGGLLAPQRSAHLVLQLENHRAADAADVRATYVVKIAVPDRHELAEVDKAFVRHLTVDQLSTREVDTFANEVERFPSARAYAGALADYVHGVIVKEGSESGGATLPFEAFQAKFSRALVELGDHLERPVAASVVAAARLNLNDVVAPLARSGDPRLDGCLSTLRDAATLEDSSAPAYGVRGSPLPLCPIDPDTHLVLSTYQALTEEGSAGFEGLELRADHGALSPQDRAKLRVLLARAALHWDRTEMAVRHLEALAHDGVFRGWAERELEKLS
jgi:hypothetical protein